MTYPLSYIRRTLCFFAALLTAHQGFALKFRDNDDFFLQHLQTSSYEIDPNAPALVLYEKTLIIVELVEHRGLVIRQETRRIIKVLKKSGVENADVSVAIRHTQELEGDIKKIRGTTYNLIDGKLVTRKMNDDNLRKSTSYGLLTAKFSLPAVSEGSIIDYSYTIERDFSLLFCHWEFQSDLPKLFSEAEVRIPFVCNTVAVGQNYPFMNHEDGNTGPFDKELPLAYTNRDVVDVFGTKYQINRWVRRNVAAAYNEPFTDNYKNYTESLQLELTGFESIFKTTKIISDWEALNKSLYESSYYRSIHSLGGEGKEKVRAILAQTTDTLERAKKIFRYVRDHVRAEPTYSFGVDKTPGEVFKEGRGSRSEINMLLVSMLQEAAIDAEPAIIGTKDQLKPIASFPAPDRFNRTICRVKLSGVTYFTDASEPFNTFGALFPDCYNGYGRVIAKKGESFTLQSETLKDKRLVSVTGKPDGDKLLLSVKKYYGSVFSSEMRRNWIRDTSSVYAAIEAEVAKMPLGAKLVKYQLNNLRNPDTALSLEYEVTLNMPAGENEIWLSPAFISYFTENPFKSANRLYPVEMSAAMDLSYVLQLELPQNWKLEASTKPNIVQLDEKNQYKYLPDYDEAGNTLRLNARMQLNSTSFDPEKYEDLKEFFNKMVELQKTNYVLKKKA